MIMYRLIIIDVMVMNMDFIALTKEIQQDIIKWRRELHRIPEIAFELNNTSEYVRAQLEKMGIEYRVIGKTGICGIIYGENCDLTVALRADMDGLPITENTGLEFQSCNANMHACGHDAHMAMLLGAASIITRNKQLLKVNVKLIFQPAEENVGGAQTLIKEGCLEDPKVDAIFGLHVGNLSEEVGNGQIGVMAGAMMAAVDDFSIKIIGRGGHGAAPHQCIDPVIAAGELICSLQKIVSREIAPVNPAVLTIGKIAGGQAFNIIPDEVELEGCVRSLTDKDREYIEKRFHKLVTGICEANRSRAEICYYKKYPVLINDSNITNKLIASASDIIGRENVIVLKNPVMASEDMSYYLREVPGTFFYLGTNNTEKNIEYPNHHPKFNVDEEVLWIGTAVLSKAVFDFEK